MIRPKAYNSDLTRLSLAVPLTLSPFRNSSRSTHAQLRVRSRAPTSETVRMSRSLVMSNALLERLTGALEVNAGYGNNIYLMGAKSETSRTDKTKRPISNASGEQTKAFGC